VSVYALEGPGRVFAALARGSSMPIGLARFVAAAGPLLHEAKYSLRLE
jgi:hypothetical protein